MWLLKENVNKVNPEAEGQSLKDFHFRF